MKLKQYLIPKTIDTSKENPLGIILGFRKVLPNNNNVALFLIFNFITARVERFLINTEDPNFIKYSAPKSEYLDFNIDRDTFYIDKKRYLINFSNEHSKLLDDDSDIDDLLLNKNELLRPYKNKINEKTGLISKRFYDLFIWELFRDYIFNLINGDRFISFRNPDMNIIRKLSRPIIKLDNDNLELTLGSGYIPPKIVKFIKEDKQYQIKDIISFQPPMYLRINPILPYTLFVPETFIKANVTNLIKKENRLNIKSLNKKDYPMCLLDLKATLNWKNIENVRDLSQKIKLYNFTVSKRLKQITKYS
jgi:hypothetical protein